MEVAAIAWVAHMFDVPLFALKAVTDIVDSARPTAEEFLENLAAASNALKVCSAPYLSRSIIVKSGGPR